MDAHILYAVRPAGDFYYHGIIQPDFLEII